MIHSFENSNAPAEDTEEYLVKVYQELRQLARSRLSREAPDHTLTPTALVHEVYLRLHTPDSANPWESTAHFFGAAAESMRRLLIDHARRRNSLKRGFGKQRVEFSPTEISFNLCQRRARGVLELSESLDAFAVNYPKEAKLVVLRFFGGLTMDEASKVLNITRRTAQRYWAFAKAKLSQIMADGSVTETDPGSDIQT